MAKLPRHLLRTLLFCAASVPAYGASGTPQDSSATADKPQDIVARGEYLARVGDCVACHTAPGGKPYAGGYYMNTPFGSMPTPNLTPDKATGIGSWTDDQFYRALHHGVDNQGNYLYPGLPYLWYTHVTRDDVLAIKAYLFSLPPVNAPRKPLNLVFPFNIRAGIAGWDALYFKPGTFQPDNSKSPEWNRGAYLVEGLGHCADCHTPHNIAQAPIADQAFAGGKRDDWYAPNLTSDPKQGIGTWSENQIVHYLKKGYDKGKGVAIGPMAQTVHDSLSHLTDSDLHAIAVYLKSLPPKQSYKPEEVAAAPGHDAGLDVYMTNCSSCHQPDGNGLPGAVPPLTKNGAVIATGPEDVIRAVIGGLPAAATYGPMPGFATILSAEQVADVANYVRSSWSNKAPATATAAMVTSLQPKSDSMMAGTHWCAKPTNPDIAGAIGDDAGEIAQTLQATNQSNELPQAKKLIADLRQKVPNISQSDIVNGLTDGYCQVVFKDPSIKPSMRGPRLDQFASLVYTELQESQQASARNR